MKLNNELKIYPDKKDNIGKQIEFGKIKPYESYSLSFEKAVINLSPLDSVEYLLSPVDYKSITSKYLR